jgi:hypothetical protein
VTCAGEMRGISLASTFVILSRVFPQAEEVSDAIVADFHTRVQYLFSKPRYSVLMSSHPSRSRPRPIFRRRGINRLDRVEICDAGRRFQTADATARRPSKMLLWR